MQQTSYNFHFQVLCSVILSMLFCYFHIKYQVKECQEILSATLGLTRPADYVPRVYTPREGSTVGLMRLFSAWGDTGPEGRGCEQRGKLTWQGSEHQQGPQRAQSSDTPE